MAENKERQNVHAKILPFKLQIKTSSKTDNNAIINIILKLMLFYDPKGETNKQTNIKRHFQQTREKQEKSGDLERRRAVKEEGNIIRIEQHAVGGTDNNAI